MEHRYYSFYYRIYQSTGTAGYTLESPDYGLNILKTPELIVMDKNHGIILIVLYGQIANEKWLGDTIYSFTLPL